MKTATLRFFVTSWMLWAVHAFGQGTFQNLNFESPITPLVPSGSLNEVPTTNAVPGWTVYLGTDQYSMVRYNQISIGGAAVSLLDPGYGGSIIQGSYMVVLYPGLSPITSQQVSSSIGQTRMIPDDAESLRFAAHIDHQIDVSFAGINLSLVLMGQGPNASVLYGAIISGFAGQPGELRFTAPNLGGTLGANHVYLDDIFFSPEAIPEPGVFTLFGFGALLLGWRVRQNRI